MKVEEETPINEKRKGVKRLYGDKFSARKWLHFETQVTHESEAMDTSDPNLDMQDIRNDANITALFYKGVPLLPEEPLAYSSLVSNKPLQMLFY